MTLPNALMIGTGEYTTGYVHGQASDSDKGAGVEAFVDAALAIRAGKATPNDFAGKLATIQETATGTAILEAGRRSLDDGGRAHSLVYDEAGQVVELQPR